MRHNYIVLNQATSASAPPPPATRRPTTKHSLLLAFLGSHRHQALSVELGAEPLHLLGQAGVAPIRPGARDARNHLALEALVELLDERLPALGGLAVGEVCEDPASLLWHVGADDLAEADAGVASDLLNCALVERGDGLLVVPVAGRWIREDTLPACLVGELDDELGLLVGEGAVGLELEAAWDELGAEVWLAHIILEKT